MENAGVEIRGGKCKAGKCESGKYQEEISGVENAKEGVMKDRNYSFEYRNSFMKCSRAFVINFLQLLKLRLQL